MTQPNSPHRSVVIVHIGNAYRRILGVVVRLIGPRAAYGLFALLARIVYRLFEPLRLHCESQCRAALGAQYGDDEVQHVAARSFVHRAWNLADLMLADGRVRADNYASLGGEIPEPYKSHLRAAKEQGRPVILVTAYYGPFDLLPLFLGLNGFPAAAVYRPHRNPSYDTFRNRVRGASGCELVPLESARARVPQVLESGGTVAILADHPAGKRGVEVTFLGVPTLASRAVGMLAEHYAAVVVVAGIRRMARPFRFELIVADLFDENDWANAEDRVAYITRRYLAAQERMIRAAPEQYLWAHTRWGPADAEHVKPPTPVSADRD